MKQIFSQKAGIRRLIKSEFFKNAATLVTGASMAQLIPMLISPILSRLYLPHDFGTVALFLAITGFISIIVTGQYESAIMLPKSDNEAINIVVLGGIITVIISVLCLILFILFGNLICRIFENADLYYYLFLVPFSVFLTGIYQIFNFWAIRKKKFKRIAIRQVSQAVSSSSVKLGYGIINPISAGLIIGNIGGQLLATSVLVGLTLREEKNLFSLVNKEKIKNVASKFQNFPKYIAPQAFLDTLNASSIIFILGYFYSNTILGLYSFAFGMVTLPMKLIGTSLSQVFYQKASEAFNDGKALWPITKKMLTRLSLIGIPSFLVIIFIGPSLFSIVFGGRWHDAGIYAQILMPWIYLVFIGSPIANLSSILGKQKGFFTLTLIGNLGMPIILFCFSILNNQITYLLFLMSFLGCIYYFIAIMWIRSITKINDVKKN